MTDRTPAEVLKEMARIRKLLFELLAEEDPEILLVLDFDYFANRINDLKQELRIARARE